MKLISCYIENYGAISRREYSFDDEITGFLGANGTGKTTLASFIKAMFYGLPSYKANSKTFDDRQRFYPFGGGKFGGNLVFAYGGSVYRIERIFDKKSNVRDELRIFKDNKIFDGFGSEPGKAVFGLDVSSFERTAFLTAEEIEITSDGDINAKLNRDVSAERDCGLELALKALEIKRKDIKADRGKGGLLDREKEIKRNLSEEIADLKELEKGLSALYVERAELAADVDNFTKRAEAANEARLVEEKRATYDRYLDDLKEKRGKITELGKLPSSEVLEELNDKRSEIQKNRDFCESLALGTYRKNGFSELEKKFSSLDEEKLAHITGLIEKYRQNGEEEKGERRFAKKFAKAYLIAALVAVLLAVGGVCACFFNFYAGVALIAVGVLALACDGFLYLKNRLDGAQTEHTTGANTQLQREIMVLLAEFGYNGANIFAEFSAFTADLSRYRSQRAELMEADERCAAFNKRNARLEEEISAVLCEYDLLLNEDIRGSINELDRRRRLYDILVKEEEALSERAERYRQENNLTELAPPSEDYEKVIGELENKRRQLALVDRRIYDDEGTLERLPVKENAREETEQRIEKLKDAYELVTLTENYLKRADKNLKDRYVKPVKAKFDYYAQGIENELGGKLSMSEDFSLTFESGGELRSFRHLSAGQRSIIGLCLRLALIDNMYTEEKPFLIMDDPFVNLDGTNLSGVLKVLRGLSKDIQIIYFTCHESRLLK